VPSVVAATAAFCLSGAARQIQFGMTSEAK